MSLSKEQKRQIKKDYLQAQEQLKQDEEYMAMLHSVALEIAKRRQRRNARIAKILSFVLPVLIGWLLAAIW